MILLFEPCLILCYNVQSVWVEGNLAWFWGECAANASYVRGRCVVHAWRIGFTSSEFRDVLAFIEDFSLS